MDDPANIIMQLALLFVLILVNAFFAMSEIAIISLNDNLIDKLADEGHNKAKKIKKLTENPSSFLSTIQIGVTLAGFLTSASAATTFARMLTEKLSTLSLGIPLSVINGVSIVLITIIISYFSLVLGELAPKSMAMQKPEKIAYAVVDVLLIVKKVCSPFVKLLSVSTNAIVRLLGFDPEADLESVTEEEIRLMVDVGQERGVIEDIQKEMINNIFEFDDICVSDIMTHRTDMIAVQDTDTIEDVVALSIEHGYSRIPVFHEDHDDIVGVIYIKDLLQFITSELPKSKKLTDVMRPALHVPFSKNCGKLFAELTENHIQMAVVVDEYGGTAGIITMEDLIESILGNIQDEYDKEEDEIVEVSETEFTIDGITDIDEVNELVGGVIPEGDYETLAGFIIGQLGYLPKDKELTEVEYENLKFTILNVDDKRIGKVKVEINLPDTIDETQDNKKEK